MNMNNIEIYDRASLLKHCDEQMRINADMFKRGELTYEELHANQYILIKLIEDLKGHDKIYAILKNAYEDDDIEHGDLNPIYVSLSKEKRDTEWRRIISICKDDVKKFDNAEIYTDEDNEFSYSIGSWIYDYALEDYPLNVNMEYGFNKKR